MITKKRCPFRRQDCTDKCALYDESSEQCAIKQMAGELYCIADVAIKQLPEQKQEDQA